MCKGDGKRWRSSSTENDKNEGSAAEPLPLPRLTIPVDATADAEAAFEKQYEALRKRYREASTPAVYVATVARNVRVSAEMLQRWQNDAAPDAVEGSFWLDYIRSADLNAAPDHVTFLEPQRKPRACQTFLVEA